MSETPSPRRADRRHTKESTTYGSRDLWAAGCFTGLVTALCAMSFLNWAHAATTAPIGRAVLAWAIFAAGLAIGVASIAVVAGPRRRARGAAAQLAWSLLACALALVEITIVTIPRGLFPG